MIWPMPVTLNIFMFQKCAFTGRSHRGATGAVKKREEKRGPRTVLWRVLYMSPEWLLVTSYSLTHAHWPCCPTSCFCLFDIWKHHNFLFILDTSQHPSTLWVECQDKVRLDSPRNFPCSRDSLGARELWRTKIQSPPLPSHSNLRRCKFHVSWWWQIRGGRPDNTAAAGGIERQAD